MKTKQEIIETNKKQKEFYNNKKKNFFSKIWAGLRNGVLNKIKKNIGIQNQAYSLHKEWFGDLSQKKVLDLGCFSGNYLSLYLAEQSKQYIGIDLSDKAITKLSDKLKLFPNAQAIAVDFLSDEFAEKNFDLIYAYGVLHHFPNTDLLINKLNEKLAPGAAIISYDPLETSWPIKIMRLLYRPFQSDAEWEWPFTKKTVYNYCKAFDVVERRGILGKSKWVFLVNFLPISEVKKQEIGKKWHQEDWQKSSVSDRVLFRCMHLTMHMKKRE
jgi:2-polyprenyl-3-methyl-5-hydroxy-6-metoxy-1,4-benzoquinol methylase